MDALAFLRTLVSVNLDAALSERTDNFHDLVWGREENSFVLGLEATIPKAHRRLQVAGTTFSNIIYEVTVRADAKSDVALIKPERIALRDPLTGTERPVALRDETHAQFIYEDGNPH